jgi:hypothetical protein
LLKKIGGKKNTPKGADTMKVKIIHKKGHKIIDLNRKKGCRERCLNCSGWSAVEVKRCQQTDCPLYNYRMTGNNQNAKERDNALKKYCLECCFGNSHEVKKCSSKDCPLYAFRNAKLDRSIETNPRAVEVI